MTIYVLGAGPAGLAVVDGLADAKGERFVLIEMADAIGGLARTLDWSGVGSHDLGPHKIFSLDDQLVDRVTRLLPDSEWITREKSSRIYMAGHYLPYPPSPFSLAKVFGLLAFFRMVIGFGLAQISGPLRRKPAATFEADLNARIGAPLYRALFKPIAEKLWGNPATLDAKLSLGRVQTPKIGEVVRRVISGAKQASKFEALTFQYPRGGLQKVWEAIAAKAGGQGEILLGHKIVGLRCGADSITEITVRNGDVERVFKVGPGDQVVSTLPLSQTIRLLGESVPSMLRATCQSVVRLNDLILVFLHVDVPSLLDESWVFVPDPDVIFHRMSEQESFDPSMTPHGSIVCCEIMSGASRNVIDEKDKDLVARVLHGLRTMGVTRFMVLDTKVIRLRNSYPVFNQGYEQGLSQLLAYLDRFKNFKSIGRQGAFNYIGTLDAMDIGYGFVRWLERNDGKGWTAERSRTSHYPVLD